MLGERFTNTWVIDCLNMEDVSNPLVEGECLVHKVLNRMPIGIFLVDADERVCFMNHAAKVIIALNDGLSLNKGKLQVENPEEYERLSKLVLQTTQETACSSDDVGESVMVISRTNNSRAYNILIQPLQFTDSVVPATCKFSVPVAIIYVSDPEQIHKLTSKTFYQLYKLTPAEARVMVELTNGFNREQIAEQLDIGIDAVHAHLQKIFKKTGTHRQAELINLIRNSPIDYWRSSSDKGKTKFK
jgi:DNA-binding CsgD family transcriptional regulator